MTHPSFELLFATPPDAEKAMLTLIPHYGWDAGSLLDALVEHARARIRESGERLYAENSAVEDAFRHTQWWARRVSDLWRERAGVETGDPEPMPPLIRCAYEMYTRMAGEFRFTSLAVLTESHRKPETNDN